MALRSRRRLALAGVWLLASVAACGARAPLPPRGPTPQVDVSTSALVETLDEAHQPLRARFERDVGLPRLLVLASPT